MKKNGDLMEEIEINLLNKTEKKRIYRKGH